MGASPIPRRRVQVEDKLVRAIRSGRTSQIIDALEAFPWDAAHRELVCIGLAEVQRRQPPAEGAVIASRVLPWCSRSGGGYCSRPDRPCPVWSARQGQPPDGQRGPDPLR